MEKHDLEKRIEELEKEISERKEIADKKEKRADEYKSYLKHIANLNPF